MKLSLFAGFLVSAAAIAGPLEDARTNFENGQFGEGDTTLLTWLEASPNDPRVSEAFDLLAKEDSIASRRWPDHFKMWATESNVRGDFSRFYGGMQNGWKQTLRAPLKISLRWSNEAFS